MSRIVCCMSHVARRTLQRAEVDQKHQERERSGVHVGAPNPNADAEARRWPCHVGYHAARETGGARRCPRPRILKRHAGAPGAVAHRRDRR
jgi:hypothetical protein